MPPIETADLEQTAALWAATGGYDRYGEPEVAASPVDVACRWNDAKGEVGGADGHRISYDASVVLDREVPVGSRMYLGSAEDWAGTGSGGTVSEVLRVVHMAVTVSLKNRFTRYEAKLARYKDDPDAE